VRPPRLADSLREHSQRIGIDLRLGDRTVVHEQIPDIGIARHLLSQRCVGIQQILPVQDAGARVEGADPVGGQ